MSTRTLITSLCWGVVVLTWIAAAVYGARKEAPGRRQPGRTRELWRVAAFVVVLLVLRIAHRDLQRIAVRSVWVELLGLAILVAATAFTLWARAALGRMWSISPNVLQEQHELRTEGPYGVTRHPIYTGLLGMLLGTALVNGLGAWLLLLVLGAALYATRVPVEERLMSATFPAGYASYRRRVPQIVPGLRLLGKSRRDRP
jgi:protein-S-isoprenylcysteine O-methyltransferase Ste14